MKKLSSYYYSILTFGAMLPGVAFGQGVKDAMGRLDRDVQSKTGLDETSIENIIGTGIGAALSFVGIMFLIFMVYGGILWMTARGDEAPITKAKSIIKAAIIGLIIVSLAYAITAFVTGTFS